MNIFVLDYDPVKAAKMQCDKHVVKMSLETAQLLCSAFPKGKAPYKQTHVNHPCSIWCRNSKANYLWLITHGIALCDEYQFRYNKVHKSKKVILWCKKNIRTLKFQKKKKTHFALCFSERFKIGNAVQSYRKYYKTEKHTISAWKKLRERPKWFYD